MRLETATYKAIEYACKKFHYSKCVPVNTSGYSVFNDSGTWCGVVLFGLGANKNTSKMFNFGSGHCVELVRMALNGKHITTSKALGIAIKLVKKDNPLCKIIISYADGNQGHIGIIYQATNWYYIGDSKMDALIVNGKNIHRKSLYSKYGHSSVEKFNEIGIKAFRITGEVKRRYIYPLDKSLIPLCKSLSKPYPKNASIA